MGSDPESRLKLIDAIKDENSVEADATATKAFSISGTCNFSSGPDCMCAVSLFDG
jgi:hypothetical protein